MRKIPALIVSGFLGSGKTTLVRRLLAAAQQEGSRVAFISNELGELGVDAALLGGGESSFVELAGGCVCCALNDALHETLIALHARMDPDRIVVETSGVAVPHDVQITFWQDPIRDWISEEAVVVVVNAEQVLEGRELEGTFVEQLESADLVLLNKIDLVPAADQAALQAQVADLAPGVPVLLCDHADVDPRVLLAERAEPRLERAASAEHDHAAHAHLHERYRSWEERVPPGLSLEEVEARLKIPGRLRVKGFVSLDQGPAVVQGVGRRLEIVPADGPVDPALLGRVVLIAVRSPPEAP